MLGATGIDIGIGNSSSDKNPLFDSKGAERREKREVVLKATRRIDREKASSLLT